MRCQRKTSSASVAKETPLHAVIGKIKGLAKLSTGESSEADNLQAAN